MPSSWIPSRRLVASPIATIGKFSVLATLGREDEGQTSKETLDGPRAIEIVDAAAFMEQPAPQYAEVTNEAISSVRADDVLRSLGIGADDPLAVRSHRCVDVSEITQVVARTRSRIGAVDLISSKTMC